MYSNDAIVVESVSKIFSLYDSPTDRLKQLVNRKNQKNKEFVAVSNINLRVKKGATVGIIGRNGSGKSTLLQMIAGTLTPTSGKIRVNGRVSALLELGAGFNPEFTGRENVFLNASILGISEEETKHRFQDILDFAEIGEFIDRPVKTYSSGMFVRLAFSIATVSDPDIIIVDEALSVGDEKFQRKCYNHLEYMKAKGCTILFVSHSMQTVEQICDYAYFLDQGKLIGEGKPKEVIDQYHLKLYSQENDHLKVVNNNPQVNLIEEKKNFTNSIAENLETDLNKRSTEITSIKMYDINGQEAYVFSTGQLCKIIATVETDVMQENVIFGLRIKTTQGIEVYGTSSTYYNRSYVLVPGKKTEIIYTQEMRLMAGTYHISIAAAIRKGKNDMVYLDKKSDHVVFKIEELPVSGSGIANLHSLIEVVEG